MKTFDWEKFRFKKIAVYCNTEQECGNFLEMAEKHGIVLRDTSPQSNRTIRTCYYVDINGCLCCADYNWCVRHLPVYDWSVYHWRVDAKGNKILEWSDYMEFTNEELRVGMLVETSFGKGIVMPSHSESVVVGSGGDWCSLDFEDVEKVWDYPDDPHFTLDCTGRYRKLLYERPTTKEMTVEEVSKALGYNVKIVKGQ